jgi:uncharacterized protein YndB with AHSA1/START domain
MTETTRTVTVSRRIPRPIDAVFEAWITPEWLTRWYAPVDDWIVGKSEVVPGVGGHYLVHFGPAPEGMDYVEQGTYLEFDRPNRLAWEGTVSDGEEEVLRTEITFAADGDGTLVTVTETGLRSEESAAEHEEGWTTALENLENALVG